MSDPHTGTDLFSRPEQAPAPHVYSVTELTAAIRGVLEMSFDTVWLEGEISGYKVAQSQHAYFNLKDDRAQIRCVMFRGHRAGLKFEPADGDQVLLFGRVSVYEARGEYQIIAETMEPRGLGALQKAYEQLKAKLEAEGLFDPARKKPLPEFPWNIGVVTSPTGAAVRDIVATFRRRFPAIPLLVHPVAVQGADAVEQICAALRSASLARHCDVLILARGGGSLEDLQAFNDERVARAVFECELPVVCGVGHETDFTICDFVADRRAPTPTAAAELVSPNAEEWLQTVAHTGARLAGLMRGRLEQTSQRVDWLSRLIVHPRQQLRARAARLQSASGALAGGIRSNLQALRLELLPLPARLVHASPASRIAALGHRLELANGRARQGIKTGQSTRRQHLQGLASRLNSVNPLAVLARGYAMVTDPLSQALVKSVGQARVGADVEVRLSDGRLRCTVTDTSSDA